MIRKIDTRSNISRKSFASSGCDVDYSKHRLATVRAQRMSIDVGGHLKAVRTMYGLSQRELAKRAGVTNGTISLIEQNRVSPSVSSLKKVLDGVPMSLAEFFTLDLQATPQVFYARDELTDIGDRDVSLRLVAAQAAESRDDDHARALPAQGRHRRGHAESQGRGGRHRRQRAGSS